MSTMTKTEESRSAEIGEAAEEGARWCEEMAHWRVVHLKAFAMLTRIESEVREQQLALEEHAEAVRAHENERHRLERALAAGMATPERQQRRRLLEERSQLEAALLDRREVHLGLRRRYQKLVAKLKVLERMSAPVGSLEAMARCDLLAADLMTPEVITIEEGATLPKAAAVLIDYEISGAVVTGGDGLPVGVLSATDIAMAVSEPEDPPAREADFFGRGDDPEAGGETFPEIPDSMAEVRVRDVMNPEIYTVAFDTPAAEIARRMVDEHLHRLLVVRDEQLIGIVSSTDMLGLLVE